jgi:hypothetical protein
VQLTLLAGADSTMHERSVKNVHWHSSWLTLRPKGENMRTTKRTLLVLAAVLLLVGVMPALAQDSRAPAPEPSVAQGQLLKVDATARTIAIRSAQGAQMQFSYTEDTKVVGADQGVAGLATMSGANVTIQFVRKGQDNVATQIEVRQKKQQQ